MKKTIDIKIVDNRVCRDFLLPRYMTEGSAGLDLFVCLDRPVIIYPNKTKLFSTGIAVYISDPKIAGIILPRSGLGHYHGIILSNSVGLIDSDYQGEIQVSLWNRGEEEFILTPGKRVAQLLFISLVQVQFSLVTSFKSCSMRGTKGFGHSM
ncbi:deoxyuridine 5'-triphosphate nucleotidohydrolase [Candidatus Blochmanniella vafra str. BVAF]|uniref:dUTP diphosphatase n=1 Tax=Blochmanniella vafra (strain BVAF) TaxID=859654 RepID=E8Q791_BLOVB|nr:dUTP diphosphatase [Candidatus Blochmannia vafer]ADV33986.1 deoxyuridine 5'-triphosphate nucleotidohydrolase [Candidatus Blochmannia vafer str. BVAF]